MERVGRAWLALHGLGRCEGARLDELFVKWMLNQGAIKQKNDREYYLYDV